MRRLAWLTAVLTVVVGFLLLRQPGSEPVTSMPASASSPTENSDQAQSPTPEKGERVVSPEPKPQLKDVPDPARPLTYRGSIGPGEAIPPGFVGVKGSIKVRDGEEEYLTDLSGTVDIKVFTRDSKGKQEERLKRFEVKKGLWSADFPHGSKVGSDSARLGGRAIRIVLSGTAVEQGSVIEFSGWFVDTRLRVVDAATGDDLEDVTITDRSGLDCFLRPPADIEHETLCEGEASPFLIRAEETGTGSASRFVRAKGYGWSCVWFESPPRYEKVIQLQREATLAITVANLPLAHAAVLRIRPMPGSPEEQKFLHHLLWEMPLDASTPTVVLDALAPRPLRISVEVGRAGHALTAILAEQQVQLLPDRKTSVLLTCAAPPDAPPAVPLAGTLTIPAAWEPLPAAMTYIESVAIRFEMRHRPADFDSTRREIKREDLVGTATPGLYRWDAGNVLPGAYVAIVQCGERREDAWTTEFTVGPAGNRQFELELPPPAELIVRFKGVGGPLPENPLTWIYFSSGTGQPAPISRSMRLVSGPGPHHLLVPTGPVVLSASWLTGTESFKSAGKKLHLGPGRNEVTLELNQRVGMRLILQDGEETLYCGSLWSQNTGFSGDGWTHKNAGYLPSALRIEALDGPGELVGWSGYKETTLYMSAPGRYQVSIDGLDGYLPASPQVVELRAGAVTELRIALKRK